MQTDTPGPEENGRSEQQLETGGPILTGERWETVKQLSDALSAVMKADWAALQATLTRLEGYREVLDHVAQQWSALGSRLNDGSDCILLKTMLGQHLLAQTARFAQAKYKRGQLTEAVAAEAGGVIGMKVWSRLICPKRSSKPVCWKTYAKFRAYVALAVTGEIIDQAKREPPILFLASHLSRKR